MGRRIELPQLPKGETQEQLQALYGYLYRMAEALNNNLAEIGNGDFTDEEMAVVREITGGSGTDGIPAEAETLKSLIIKTAQLIKSEIDEYNLKLIGTYTAEGKLGRYVRKTRLDVDVTPTGIQQNYTFQDIIQGLKTYEVNAKNYIKTGLLRTVSSIPVYGVAIGKDVVTFSEDGTETYNDGNKVAELTADELSFWQNGNKVASYTGTKIELYSGTKKLLIDSSGVKIYDGSTILAEFLPGGLKFYYNGTLRTQMDTDGVKIYDGSTLLATMNSSGITFTEGATKLAELLANGLTFYHNNEKRVTTDATGMTFYKGTTKLAELLNSALKFYYNGTLRTQMDTDGVKIYDGSTMLMKITGSRISFYYNGTETFYILNGKMYAAGDMEIASGKTFKIVSGGVIDVDTNNFKIDSTNKKVISGVWQLNDRGMAGQIHDTDPDWSPIEYIDYILTLGKFENLYSENNKPTVGLAGRMMPTSVNNVYQGIWDMRVIQPSGTDQTRILFHINPADSSAAITAARYISDVFQEIDGCLGDDHSKWEIFGSLVRFDTLRSQIRDYDPDWDPVEYIDYAVKMGQLANVTGESSQPVLGLAGRMMPTSGNNVYQGFWSMQVQQPAADDITRIAFFINPRNNTATITAARYVSDVFSAVAGCLGDNQSKWEIYGSTVHYDTLAQNSSREIKHDIRNMESRGEKLDKLRPVTFVYNNDPNEKVRAGLIYEETAEVLPEICREDDGGKAINYTELVPMLLKEIQELRARVKALEER